MRWTNKKVCKHSEYNMRKIINTQIKILDKSTKIIINF